MEKRTIGSFIAALRKAKGLTQRQLAEQLNVSDKAVSRWERDEALPDLMLIPVLADIFGVTSDELLRGQRDTAETPTPQAEEKSRKQLKYLLDKTGTNHKIGTLIAIMVAALGVLIAAFYALATGITFMGFWNSSGFFLVALVLQVVFHILASSKLNTEDFDSEALAQCRAGILRRSLWGYSLIFLLFLFVLPLGLGGLSGIDGYRWLLAGLLFVAVGAAVCGLICPLIYHIKCRTLKADEKQRLKRCTVAVLVSVMILTLIVQPLLFNLLSGHREWMGQGTKHRNAQTVVDLMQTPLLKTGEPYELDILQYDSKGNVVVAGRYEEDLDTYATVHIVEEWWNGKWVHFAWLNETVWWIEYRDDAIYTYTDVQYEKTQRIIYGITHSLLLLYPAEIAAAVLIYRKKAKRLLLGEKLSAKLTDVGQ